MTENNPQNVSVQKYKKALTSAYSNPQGNQLRRLNTLTAMVCGAIRTSKSYLHSLGDGILQDIDAESRVKVVKRWLLSEYNNYDVSFLPHIEPILSAYIAQNKEMVFSIDGSEAGRGCTVLMISLTISNRAIPICWLAKKCKKGHLPARMHLEVFTLLHKLLKGYKNVVVLGDGEFDNGEVIAACADWEWHFVFRTAKNTVIFDGDEEYAIKYLAPPGNELFFMASDVLYTKKRYGPVNAVVWSNRKLKEPIYLLSNFELTYQLACYYKKRWSIETMFSDMKSRGFNIHKSKISDSQRIEKLLIVICLAYILVFRLGQQEYGGVYKAKITAKHKDDLSIFTYGKKLIEYCLKHSIQICFSFSKNCVVGTL